MPDIRDFEMLQQSLRALIQFVEMKGREYFHEMNEDFAKLPKPLTDGEFQSFVELDGKVFDDLRACGIRFDPPYQPLTDTERKAFVVGQTQLRFIDTAGGRVICYSDKWKGLIKSHLASAERQLSRLALNPNVLNCRIEVDLSPREDDCYPVRLDHEYLAPVGIDSAQYLDSLIAAGKGRPVSGSAIEAKFNLKEGTFNATRAKNALPKRVRELIDSKSGRGSWLKDEAWK